jgi:hypothetical protein
MLFEIRCAACDSQLGSQGGKKWGKIFSPVTYTVCTDCKKLSQEGAQKISDFHHLDASRRVPQS